MTLLMILLAFALGVALAKHVVKIGLKLLVIVGDVVAFVFVYGIMALGVVTFFGAAIGYIFYS